MNPSSSTRSTAEARGQPSSDVRSAPRLKQESTENVRKRACDSNPNVSRTRPQAAGQRRSRKKCFNRKKRFHPSRSITAGIHIPTLVETWNHWQRMGNNDERCSMDPPHPSGSRRCTRIETTARLRAASTTNCTAIPRPHKRSSSSQVLPINIYY